MSAPTNQRPSLPRRPEWHPGPLEGGSLSPGERAQRFAQRVSALASALTEAAVTDRLLEAQAAVLDPATAADLPLCRLAQEEVSWNAPTVAIDTTTLARRLGAMVYPNITVSHLDEPDEMKTLRRNLGILRQELRAESDPRERVSIASQILMRRQLILEQAFGPPVPEPMPETGPPNELLERVIAGLRSLD